MRTPSLWGGGAGGVRPWTGGGYVPGGMVLGGCGRFWECVWSGGMVLAGEQTHTPVSTHYLVATSLVGRKN